MLDSSRNFILVKSLVNLQSNGGSAIAIDEQGNKVEGGAAAMENDAESKRKMRFLRS